MKNLNKNPFSGFTIWETTIAILLFGLFSAATIQLYRAVHQIRVEGGAANTQNAYSVVQAQMAQAGVNPTQGVNPLSSAIVISAPGKSTVASFDAGATSTPTGGRSDIAGSAKVRAINYKTGLGAAQSGMGAGIGFGTEIAGTALPVNQIQLAPPSFNISGDLTSASFPINGIAAYPGGNPPGTVYRATYDGTTPTILSSIWNNNPGWTTSSFPRIVTIRAFNTDPQYSPSVPVSATYSMVISVNYVRADSRGSNIYTFNLTDIGSPASYGIILSANGVGTTIYYTLDGSTPTSGSTLYSAAFTPTVANFTATPTVILKVIAMSSDSRFASSSVASYSLIPGQLQLPAPTILTDNSASLNPGGQIAVKNNDGGNADLSLGTPTGSTTTVTGTDGTVTLPTDS